MSNHTPGPWLVKDDENPSLFCDGYHQLVAGRIVDGGFVISGFISTPNLNLIVAAPDLLEALQRLADAWDKFSPDTVTLSGRPSAIQQARAAIAKATGGQS